MDRAVPYPIHVHDPDKPYPAGGGPERVNDMIAEDIATEGRLASRGHHVIPQVDDDADLPSDFYYDPISTLTPVMNQWRLPLCWAYAMASTLADRVAVSTLNSDGAPTVARLSPQSIFEIMTDPDDPWENIEQDPAADTALLSGGNLGLLFDALSTVGAKYYIPAEWDYPSFDDPTDVPYDKATKTYSMGHVAAKRESHKADSGAYSFRFTGFGIIPSNIGVRSMIATMKKEIMTNGPVCALLGPEVSSNLNGYSGDTVLNTQEPQKKRLGRGHAVEVVGWVTDGESGEGAWIVRNSWGCDWPSPVPTCFHRGFCYIKIGLEIERHTVYAPDVGPANLMHPDAAPQEQGRFMWCETRDQDKTACVYGKFSPSYSLLTAGVVIGTIGMLLVGCYLVYRASKPRTPPLSFVEMKKMQ